MVIVLVDPGLGRRNLIRCLSEAEPEGFVAIGSANWSRVVLHQKFPRSRWNVTVGRRWFWGGKTLDELRIAGGQRQSTLNPALANLTPATSADDPAAIIFTSGSTGPPKGVLYTQQMFDTQAEEIQSNYGIEAGWHRSGLFSTLCTVQRSDGRDDGVTRHGFFAAGGGRSGKALAAANDWQVTQAFASPAVWRVLSDHCAGRASESSHCGKYFPAAARCRRMCYVPRSLVSAKMPKCTLPMARPNVCPSRRLKRRKCSAKHRPEQIRAAGICVGRKFDSIDWRVIRITDEPIATIDQVEELPTGEIGELIVRGPQVSLKYVTRVEANAQSKIADRDWRVASHRRRRVLG